MQVTNLMTLAPVVARPETTVGDAMALLDELKVRHLPVVRGERLVGMVSDRDLCGLARSLAEPPCEVTRKACMSRRLDEVMSSEPVTVAAHAEVSEAIRLFAAQPINALPVVDALGYLVGMLSTADVLMWMSKAMEDVRAAGSIAPSH